MPKRLQFEDYCDIPRDPPLRDAKHQPSQRGRRRHARALGQGTASFFAMDDADRQIIHELSKVGRRRGPRTKW